jgi:hypothetical protein
MTVLIIFMKTKAFWDIAPCSFVATDRGFGGAYYLHHQGDNGGNTHLSNVYFNYTAGATSQQVIFELAAMRT